MGNNTREVFGPLSLPKTYQVPGTGTMEREMAIRLYLHIALESGYWTGVQLWDLEECRRLTCDYHVQEREAVAKRLHLLQKRNVMAVIFGRVVHAATRGMWYASPPAPYLEGDYKVVLRWCGCWATFSEEKLYIALRALVSEGYFVREVGEYARGVVFWPTQKFVEETQKAQRLLR